MCKQINAAKKKGDGITANDGNTCTPIWKRGNYCHTHGYGVAENYLSTTCFKPGPNHKHAVNGDNTMGDSETNKVWDA